MFFTLGSGFPLTAPLRAQGLGQGLTGYVAAAFYKQSLGVWGVMEVKDFRETGLVFGLLGHMNDGGMTGISKEGLDVFCIGS